jgi:hypothetical protein
MTFSPVPEESKSQIKKAGEILISEHPQAADYKWALDLADKWRACHAYPINTFQATLRVKLKKFSKDVIVAQRLKRMPTIIDKLKRFPNMQLTTMHDIGGLRAVLGSVNDVYKLTNDYTKSSFFAHSLIHEYDYIRNPRDEDGYRSIHLIYKYINKQHPKYNGLRIELQIRTKLQHIWATAVETMGTFLGQALKSRQGDQQWLDFFALTSSAFAHREKSTPVPRYQHLSAAETYQAVADAEIELRALEKMRGLSTAANEIVKSRSSGKGWSYHLIILNSLEKTIKIRSYNRESFDQAVNDYSNVELEASSGVKIEPVLVSAGPFVKLRRAYPNFFLDIGDFITNVNSILSTARKNKQTLAIQQLPLFEHSTKN